MTTSHELTAIAGLSYRQVDYWTRTGYLRTVGDPTPGSGGASREYDDHQVALACQMSRLIRWGLTVPAAFEIASDIISTGRAVGFGYVLTLVHDAHVAEVRVTEAVA